LKVINHMGRELPARLIGRIMVKGPVLFSRYLGQDDSIADPEEWFETGDIGRIDREGYLTVAGRTDNTIISGGENIDLNRIEKAIAGIYGIDGVVVMGRKSRKWGERPVAFVASSEIGITEESIKTRLRSEFPAFMIPDEIIVLNSLPLTGSGKYDCLNLREQYHLLFEDKD
jgi:acyl-CoA synthetase (AMP-forming)/AMP-acid ligase II